MALGSQTIVAGIALCCVFASVILSSSSAPTSSSADKKMIVKDETIIRHKDIGPLKQEVISSTNTTAGTPREETKAKSKPKVEGQSKVVLNSVPGQLESILSAADRLEKQEKTPPVDNSRHDAPPSDEHFLQDQEDEEEEEEEDLPEEDVYKRWQKFMNDPRLRTALEDKEGQQRSGVESKMNYDLLYSPELVEYIARMDEVDRTIEDLVNKGKISPQEATWYREVLDMEYGAPLPPLPPAADAETQPFVEIPDNAYEADDVYDGSNNYIFRSDPPRDYSADDDSQPTSPEDRFIPGEEEEKEEQDEEEEEEGSDYDSSKEREEELLREVLGMMSLRDNEQEPLTITSAENKSQKLNHPPVPVSLQQNDSNVAVEKELESLPVQLNANKTPEVKGTEEEVQLEEVRNRKPKQDNRTKLIAKGQNQFKKNPK